MSPLAVLSRRGWTVASTVTLLKGTPRWVAKAIDADLSTCSSVPSQTNDMEALTDQSSVVVLVCVVGVVVAPTGVVVVTDVTDMLMVGVAVAVPDMVSELTVVVLEMVAVVAVAVLVMVAVVTMVVLVLVSVVWVVMLLRLAVLVIMVLVMVAMVAVVVLDMVAVVRVEVLVMVAVMLVAVPVAVLVVWVLVTLVSVTLPVVMVAVTILISGVATDNDDSSTSKPSAWKLAARDAEKLNVSLAIWCVVSKMLLA